MTSDARSSRPAIHFPPPLLFVAGFLLATALHRYVTAFPLNDGRVPATIGITGGWLLIGAGLLLMIWGIATFARARTAIVPFRAATTLVSGGPYRFTRNPMYVGMTLIYSGLALLLDRGWPFVLLPLVLLALYHLVIRREERHLADVFGDGYFAYQRRVRRWL